MRIFLTTVLFLYGVTLGLAQDTSSTGNLTFEPEQPQAEVIKLSSNISVHQFEMPVKNIEIVTICSDNAALGTLQYRKEKVRAMAIPDKPLQEYFQEYVNKQYGDQYKKESGKHLLCVIRYLRIGDKRDKLEKSYVRIKAVAFVSADNQQFQLSCQIDTTLVNDTKHASREHSGNIARAIDQLMQAADKPEIKTAFHSKEEIIIKAWEPYKQPVYTVDTFANGIYGSYREFLKNAPSVKDFKVNSERGKLVAYRINANGTSTVINEPWGMCYQGKLYRFKWNSFIPMRRTGLAFDFVELGLENDSDLKSSGGRKAAQTAEILSSVAVFGPGVLGAFIPRAFIAGGYPVSSIPYLVDLPIATTIDPFTGDLMF